jgi:hypothetical protein
MSTSYATLSPPVPAALRPGQRRIKRVPAHPDAFAFTVDDACAMSGLGRTKLYELRAAGALHFRKVAGRTLVDGASLRRLLGIAEPAEPAPAR